MMRRDFHLRAEISRAIAKRLPHAKNQLSMPGSLINQFNTDTYVYSIYKRFACLCCRAGGHFVGTWDHID